jgi:hypothetical protein
MAIVCLCLFSCLYAIWFGINLQSLHGKIHTQAHFSTLAGALREGGVAWLPGFMYVCSGEGAEWHLYRNHPMRFRHVRVARI